VKTVSLGADLRHAGLHPRALAAWIGADHLPAVGGRLLLGAPAVVTPAAAALALFVGGASVPVARLGPLARLVGALERRELVDVRDDAVAARLAILPVHGGLVACDRRDAEESPELVCWPDDSSYHVASALPQRSFARWLDVGCGSAFAQIVQARRASERAAIDLNPRAVRYAALGAELSELALDVRAGDLADAVDGRFDLLTCNAPIPELTGAELGPMWRSTDEGFVARLFRSAARVVAADALVVVHAAWDALAPIVADLPGERVVVVYTPEHAARHFAIAWWAPGGDARLVAARRAATSERPHLAHDDRLAALAGELPSP
jgi:SAM-dependent methyltransferase